MLSNSPHRGVDLANKFNPFYSIDEIRKALTELIDEESIRMREDSEEHDWEYVIIKK